MSNTKDRPATISMNTPIGTAKWPKLHAPDYGTAKVPKPDGEYSVKLVFREDDPAFVKFKAKMQPHLEKAIEAGRAKFAELKKPQRDKLGDVSVNDLFTIVYDENDEPTGEVEVKFKRKASGVYKRGPKEGQKWNSRIDMFDSKGLKLKKPVEIWGGSRLVIGFSFEEGGYFMPATGAVGLRLDLNAVQIVTLRQGGEKSAKDYGFGAHDDGFDADQMPPVEDDEEEEDKSFAGSQSSGADPDGSEDF